MNSMYQQLKQLPLFQGMSTEILRALVEKLPFHFLKFRGGEQIFAAGDPCTHIRFIVSGKVRLETACDNLRVSLFQTLSAPHVLAADYLFGRETVYPYSAIADGSCGILQLRKSDYIKMLAFDKVFLFNILNYLYDSICYDTINFYNASHMNRLGAEQFSTKLAKDLKALLQ